MIDELMEEDLMCGRVGDEVVEVIPFDEMHESQHLEYSGKWELLALDG